MASNYILTQSAIDLKLRRMALEIAERNIGEPLIILAGVDKNGTVICNRLLFFLKEIFSGNLQQVTISLHKKHPAAVSFSPYLIVDGAVVIIVDDVAHSGKTLTYALKPFLEFFPKKIQTLVLVDRTHKLFPIQPDYVGISLSTTLQNYIEVEIEDGLPVAAVIA